MAMAALTGPRLPGLAVPELSAADIPLEDREYQRDVEDCHVRREQGRPVRQEGEAEEPGEPEQQEDRRAAQTELVREPADPEQSPERGEADQPEESYHCRTSLRLRWVTNEASPQTVE